MITLQFSAQADLGSDLIREFDHGQFSHVDAVMPDGRLLGSRDDDVAGIPSGVQIRPQNYANFSAKKLVSIPVLDSDFYAFLNSQIGKPYDETAILAFVIDRDWRQSDSWFCSELQSAALEKCGFFTYPLAAPVNKITPDDLYMILSGRINVSA